jgi:hypothetical protein
MSFRRTIGRSMCDAATAAFVLLGALITFAAAGTAAPPAPSAAPSVEITTHFAIADFDGDSKPDLATVQVGQITASQARYWIDFELSAGSRQSIGIVGPVGGLEIAPRDVNGDRVPDLVITTALLKQPVAVLLNDGHGNFTLRDAAAFPTMVWRYERFWSVGCVQVKDGTALMRLAGACDAARYTSGIAQPPGRLLFTLPQGVAVDPPSAVHGRAPPAAVFHV